jgi:serine/threonine protein kinase, bacterial
MLLNGKWLKHGLVWKIASPTTPNATPTEMPFTGINDPIGVAVDSPGNLYVADNPRAPNYGQVAGDPQLGSNRVVKLNADLTTQTVLPFTVNIPGGVAVDSAGNLYVHDFRDAGTPSAPFGVDYRVLKLAAGSSTQTVLPFTGLKNGRAGVAVDPP